MSSHPYMQLYVGDYLSDTLDLTTEQHGAYLLLLMTMWRHDAKLPNEAAKLARIARVSPRRWPGIWSEIERFFTVRGDHIVSLRLEQEHQKAVSLSEKRSASGAKGGTAKALKNNNTGVANAKVLPEPGQSIVRTNVKATASSSSAREPAAAHVEVGYQVLKAMGIDPKDPTYLGNIGIVAQWLANGWSPELDILPTVQVISERRRARGDLPPRALNFFTEAIGEAFRRRRSAAPSGAAAVPLPILSPDNQLTLRNGKVVNRRIAFKRLKNFFERRRAGDRSSWMGVPDWGDADNPEAASSVYPQEFVAEAKAAAGISSEPKSQATTG